MTLLSGELIHHSNEGAYRLQSQRGIDRAASQKKPDTAPMTAKPSV